MQKIHRLIVVMLATGALTLGTQPAAAEPDNNSAEPPPVSLTPPVPEPYATEPGSELVTPTPVVLPETQAKQHSTAAALPGDCAEVQRLIKEKKVSDKALCRELRQIEEPNTTKLPEIQKSCEGFAARMHWLATDRFYACRQSK